MVGIITNNQDQHTTLWAHLSRSLAFTSQNIYIILQNILKLLSIIYSTTQFARIPSDRTIEALLKDLVIDISLQSAEGGDWWSVYVQ